jgi:methionyl-tRNA formyltransferase
MRQRILYISDPSRWSRIGAECVASAFAETEIIFWNYGDPPPDEQLARWEGDWILSMKNDLVLREEILRKACKGAINFHPAPPQYRGLGGYVYAIHNGDASYGITCHQMTTTVDKGPIIRVLRFPLFPDDTVSSLRERTGAFCIALLHEILLCLEHGKELPHAAETWGEKLFTRKALAEFLEQLRASGQEHLCLH